MNILKPNLEAFFAGLVQRPEFLLMLDYDGTLAPFSIDRMEAFPYPGMRECIQKLMQISQMRVVIVSGRSLSDLSKLLGLNPEPEMWGSHGLERRKANGSYEHFEMDEQTKIGLESGKQVCSSISSHHCEIKPYSIALHWRGLDDAAKSRLMSSVMNDWKRISNEYGLEIHPFDGGLELRLKGENKGSVIKTILKETSSKTKIVYFGDDLTDEDAFAALGNRGLKVIVREVFRPTLADIQLITPDEVLLFFDRLIAIYQREQ